MRRIRLSILLILVSVGPGWAQEAKPLVIRARQIWTMSGEVIQDGAILIRAGKIRAVARRVSVPDQAKVLDMTQSHVIPGLIDGHSHLGLSPNAWDEMDEAVFASSADTHILDVYDPLSPQTHVAVRAGVTSALIAPGLRNPIGGQCAVVKFSPGSPAQWLLKRDAGVMFSVTNDTLQHTRRPTSRPGMITFIREHLDQAKAFDNTTFDPQHQVLKQVVDGKLPALFAARTPDEVSAALRLIEDYRLDARLVDGRQADELVEQVTRQDVPVVYAPMLTVSKDKDLKRPGHLAGQSVKLAFASLAPQTCVSDLRSSAIMAAQYGLDPELALKGITLFAAEMLGVADRIGSLTPGKDADLVVLSGDPLEWTSAVQLVIINGNIVYQREEK